MVLVNKFKLFHLFLFGGKLDQENIFEDILERKQAFLDYKSKEFIKQIEKSKNRFLFQKGSLWIWSKNLKFSMYFFLGK